MKIEIEARTRGGLRVVKNFEDYRLGWLEGHNGIGKTISIRLLELATGFQPFLTSPTIWRSLRDNLNDDVVIIVTHISGGTRLEITLQPATWPDDPGEACQYGTAKLDDVSIPFEDIPKYFTVFRIGGDESVLDRFRLTLQNYALIAERQAKLLDDKIDKLQLEASQELQDISGFSSNYLMTLRISQESLTNELVERKSNISTLENRAKTLGAIAKLLGSLENIRTNQPTLSATLDEIHEKLLLLEQDRQELLDAQKSHRPVIEQEQLLSELQDLNAIRESALSELFQRQAVGENDANQLNVSFEHQSINQAIASNLETKRRLEAERAAILPGDRVMGVIRGVETSLQSIEEANFRDEIVAITRVGRLSAGDLRVGIGARLEEIEREGQDPRNIRIGRLLEDADLRETQLKRLKSYLTSTTRISNKVKECEAKIEIVLGKIEELNEQEYSEVAQRLQALEAERLSLVVEETKMSLHLNMLESEGSEDDLVARIERAKASIQFDNSRPLKDQIFEAETLKIQEQARCLDLEDHYGQNQDEIESLYTRLSETVAVLENAPRYSTLRELASNRFPKTHHEEMEKIRRLESLSRSVSSVEGKLGLLSSRAASLQTAIFDLANHIGHKQTSNIPAVNRIAKYFEDQFSPLLSDPGIQDSLFSGGRFQALNLLEGNISWIDSSNEVQHRPLEAFSSGELAFAYMLASILQRSNDVAKNRLLVLDEFGAFIESDRLSRLLHFLRERALGEGLFHQILIILPLREPIRAYGLKSLPELQNEINRQGYFLQAIEA